MATTSEANKDEHQMEGGSSDAFTVDNILDKIVATDHMIDDCHHFAEQLCELEIEYTTKSNQILHAIKFGQGIFEGIKFRERLMFTYPYFRSSQSNPSELLNTNDTRYMNQQWARGMGADTHHHRRIYRFWNEEDKNRLRAAVNASYFENKTQVYNEKIRDITIKLKENLPRSVSIRLEKEKRKIEDEKAFMLESHSDINDACKKINPNDIDWHSVAKHGMSCRYSPTSCRLKWVNSLAPHWTGHAREWTRNERLRLFKLVLEARFSKSGKVNWCEIAKKMGNTRSAWVVFRKYQQHLQYNKCLTNVAWLRSEDQNMMRIIRKYRRYRGGKINFEAVASRMSRRSAEQVRNHYNRVLQLRDPDGLRYDQLRPGHRIKPVCQYKRDFWKPDEDQRLISLVKQFGEHRWTEIADHMPGRISVQVSHRYRTYLKNQYLKGIWFTDEDEILIEASDNLTSNNYALIQHDYLPHRNLDDIKNRVKHLKKIKPTLKGIKQELAAAYDLPASQVPIDVDIIPSRINVKEIVDNLDKKVGGDSNDPNEMVKRINAISKLCYTVKQRSNLSRRTLSDVTLNEAKMKGKTGPPTFSPITRKRSTKKDKRIAEAKESAYTVSLDDEPSTSKQIDGNKQLSEPSPYVKSLLEKAGKALLTANTYSQIMKRQKTDVPQLSSRELDSCRRKTAIRVKYFDADDYLMPNEGTLVAFERLRNYVYNERLSVKDAQFSNETVLQAAKEADEEKINRIQKYLRKFYAYTAPIVIEDNNSKANLKIESNE